MDNIQITVTIVSAIISGILGVVISNIYNNRQQKKKLKLDLVTGMLGYGWQALPNACDNGAFCYYINQIFIVFNDSKEIITAYEDFKANYNTDQRYEKYLKLLKLIMNNVGIKYNNVNDTQFLNPAVPHNALVAPQTQGNIDNNTGGILRRL